MKNSFTIQLLIILIAVCSLLFTNLLKANAGYVTKNLYSGLYAENNSVDDPLATDKNSKLDNTLFNNILAADSGDLFQIRLEDGSILLGYVVEKKPNELVFKTTHLGTISIPYTEIYEFKEFNQPPPPAQEFSNRANAESQTQHLPNYNATRYFVNQSAYNLKKGEGYYQNTYLFFNGFNYGITDNLSVTAGFDLLSIFLIKSPTFFIMPKLGYQISDKIRIGGGVFYANTHNFEPGRWSNERFHTGLVYGLSTFGSKENNFTLGSGFGYTNEEISPRPLITLSGMVRLGRRVALVSDNLLYPAMAYDEFLDWNNPMGPRWVRQSRGYSYQAYVTYGVRLIWEKVSIDLGLFNNPEIFNEFPIGVPYFDFVIKF